MNKCIVIDNFHFNLYRLKNYINKTYTDEKKDEILLIIFNSIINSYPNDRWFEIKNSFFENIDTKYQEWIMVYTIIAYKEGIKFVNSHKVFIDDLCNILLNYYVAPYYISKYSHFFLDSNFYDLIMYAFTIKGLFPRSIMRIIIENFDLNETSSELYVEIYNIVKKHIDECNFLIFNKNYDFNNIYYNLKLLIEKYYIEQDKKIDLDLLELIPLFNDIPNDSLKDKIKKDFKNIERSSMDIYQKILNCFTIIAKYSYDIPKFINNIKKLK